MDIPAVNKSVNARMYVCAHACMYVCVCKRVPISAYVGAQIHNWIWNANISHCIPIPH